MQAQVSTAPLLSPLGELEVVLREQIGSRVANLRLSSEGDSVVVSGRSPTFYIKQLVQETLRRCDPVRPLRNEILVCR